MSFFAEAYSPERIRKLLCEAVGTFVLVFAGTGAIVINDVSHGVVTHVGVALTFGLVVTSLIYAIGDISGAHLNPAVTLGFWIARRFSGRDVIPYVASQIMGAFAASLLLAGLFTHPTLGATIPAGSFSQSFILETILTACLMFVILNVSIDAKETGVMAGVAVGSVIALEALFAGPICGASMNPARSLAPAVVSGQLTAVWIYLVAPVLGSVVGVGVFWGLRGAAQPNVPPVEKV
jgi:MIP family channel proteins